MEKLLDIYQNIEPTVLIELVKLKPIIWKWDSTPPNINDIRTAWRDICFAINQLFEFLDEDEKQDLCKVVTAKWNNMKVQWKKCDQKIKNKQLKSFKYVHYDQMYFLHSSTPTEVQVQTNNNIDVNQVMMFLKNMNNSSTTDTSSVPSTSSTPNESSKQEILEIFRNKKRCLATDASIEQSTSSALSASNENKRVKIATSGVPDSHRSFFDSLYPTVEKYSDKQLNQFRAGVFILMNELASNDTSEQKFIREDMYPTVELDGSDTEH